MLDVVAGLFPDLSTFQYHQDLVAARLTYSQLHLPTLTFTRLFSHEIVAIYTTDPVVSAIAVSLLQIGALYQVSVAAGTVGPSVALADAPLGSPAADVINSVAHIGAEDGTIYAVTIPLL